MNQSFHRNQLLLGTQTQECIQNLSVIIIGVGGVGSWCAEAFIRLGVKNLTIVDMDSVCETNINRQLHATQSTIGKPKTEALKQRLQDINPNVNVTALNKFYEKENSHEFELHKYDVIIDAIDTTESKKHLIREATKTDSIFISSMGAARRIDASRIQVAEFFKVKGCNFGRRLRKEMRQEKNLPSKKFMCVYSDETLENREFDEMRSINGSLVHITAIFGFTIAGEVVKQLYNG